MAVFIVFAIGSFLSTGKTIDDEISASIRLIEYPNDINSHIGVLKMAKIKEHKQNRMELLTIIILAITTGVIFWYSSETRRLADFTAKQISFNIRPMLILRSEGRSFFLRNVGKGIAKDITFSDIKAREIKKITALPDFKQVRKIYFESLDFLPPIPNDLRGKYIKCLIFGNDGKLLHDRNIHNILAMELLHKFKIIISYEDIDHRKYKSHMGPKNGKFSLINIE